MPRTLTKDQKLYIEELCTPIIDTLIVKADALGVDRTIAFDYLTYTLRNLSKECMRRTYGLEKEGN